MIHCLCDHWYYFSTHILVDEFLQQAYFKCAYECFDRRRSQQEISNCVENCSVPVVTAQQRVEGEMAKFQVSTFFSCISQW